MEKLTHHDLLHLGSLLGYKRFGEGICQGFSCMYTQAVLAHEEKIFFERLHFISFYKSNFLELKKEIESAQQKIKRGELIDKHEEKLLDILAFFDGVELYLYPMGHKDLFNGHTVVQDNLDLIYELAKSSKLSTSDLHVVLNKPYVFEKKTLYKYLLDLGNMLSQVDNPLPIILRSYSHTVSLKYDKTTKHWKYIDTNDFGRYPQHHLYSRELTEEKLADSIFQSLSMNDVYAVLEFVVSTNTSLPVSFTTSVAKLDARYPIHPPQASTYDEKEAGLLYLASRCGNLAAVQTLLKQFDVEINHLTNDGFSALYTACTGNHSEIVDALLKNRRLKINLPNPQGQTPLHIACICNHFDIVSTLLRHPDINVNFVDDDGLSALHSAVNSGSLESTKKLLQHPGINVNLAAANGFTPLFIACMFQHCAVVEALLKCTSINVNQTSDGMTPLFIACRDGLLDIVTALLKHPSLDINAINSIGETALFIACKQGNLPLVETLLKHPKIKLNLKTSEGLTPLQVASKNGHLEVVKCLLNQPALGINHADRYGEASLFSACSMGNLDIVNALLTHPRIRINQKNNKQLTPLLVACKNGHTAVVNALSPYLTLQINMTDQYGNSSLYYACQRGSWEMVDILLKHRQLDINQSNHEGVTPFALACSKGNTEIIEALLKTKKIDLSQKNAKGNTALHLACFALPNTHGKEKLFELLLSNGCRLSEKNALDLTALDLAIIQNNKTAISTLLAFAKKENIDLNTLLSPTTLKNIASRPYDFKNFPDIDALRRSSLRCVASLKKERYVEWAALPRFHFLGKKTTQPISLGLCDEKISPFVK